MGKFGSTATCQWPLVSYCVDSGHLFHTVLTVATSFILCQWYTELTVAFSGAVYKRKVSQRDSGDVLSVNTTPSGLRRSPIKPIVRRGGELPGRWSLARGKVELEGAGRRREGTGLVAGGGDEVVLQLPWDREQGRGMDWGWQTVRGLGHKSIKLPLNASKLHHL